MIVKSKHNNNLYVGPKVLFDSNYIPPQLLFRQKEQQTLHSILKDSLSDDFPISILYKGIQGIGKKAIVNKVCEDLSMEKVDSFSFITMKIDCKEKNPEELIGSLLMEMNRLSNFNFNFHSVLNSDISQLWSMFKLCCKKLDNYLLLIFNNIEHLDSKFISKFLHLKETKASVISTVNKVLRTSSLDILSLFDQKTKLDYFTYNELFSIIEQRASLAFLHDTDKELIEFITDLIFEHYVPVPGKGIDILRETYPVLKEKGTIKHIDMLEVCHNQLNDSQSSIDEFNILTYISEEDLLTIIFLDNLSNHFIQRSNYYITSKELKELYDISCESLEYKKSIKEFRSLIDTLRKIGILTHSLKSLIDEKYLPNLNDPLSSVYFFMNINAYQLKAMVDAVFGKI